MSTAATSLVSTSPAAAPDLVATARSAATANDRPVERRRRHWSHVLGPVVLSLFCHAVALLFLALITWVVQSAAPEPMTEYRATLYSGAQSTGPAGGFDFPGKARVNRPDSAQAAGEQQSTIGELSALAGMAPAFASDSGGNLDSDLHSLAARRLSRSDVVGLGAGIGQTGGGGQGSGLGDRDLAGGGPVGLYGVGEGQLARSVIYVMDRSGSMSENMHLLQRELKRAIGSLDAEQLFNVIWFSEGESSVLFKRRLMPATLENKRAAFEQINLIRAEGQTEPLDAVKKAMVFKPDVLFFLSDGHFGENNDVVIDLFRRLNRRRETVVNAILFLFDEGGEGERVLRTIADENGGAYRFIGEDEAKW